MEIANQELKMMAELISALDEPYVRELDQLQLLMVGGGFGDAILA